MTINAAETWTGIGNSTYLTFQTTPLGSTATAEVMRIDQTGNVGINYIAGLSAAERLTVAGNVSASGGLSANNGYHGGNVGIKINNPAVELTVAGAVSASGGLSANNGYHGGNVGIKINNPAAELTVAGTISASGGLSGNGGYYAGSVGINIINPAERLTIAGGVSASGGLSGNAGYYGGNVGIKTNNPNTELTVRGTISATGSVYGTTFINTQNVTQYNILPTDSGSTITSNVALTANITSAVYPAGFNVNIIQLGTTSITLSSNTSPATSIFNVSNANTIQRTSGQYGTVTLLYTGATWVAFGNVQ